MKRLLDAVGETYWSMWIERDIADWRKGCDVSHHLGAYGARGSLDDLLIYRANQHTVSVAQEPWANTLFECLKELCHLLARHPHETFSMERLAAEVRQANPMVTTSIAPDSDEQVLSGARCLECGYAVASDIKIDYLVAQSVIPALVFKACESLSMPELVDRILAFDVPELAKRRQSVLNAALASGIVVTKTDVWARQCPKCHRDGVVVYRWKLVKAGRLRFEPSGDNLPLKDPSENE